MVSLAVQTSGINFVGLGQATRERWRSMRHITALWSVALWRALHPGTWSGPVRRRFAHELLVLGVRSVFFIAVLAVLIGLVVVVQAARWGEGVLRPDLLDDLLVVVVVRELGPLFANLIIVVKSAAPTATVAGRMKMSDKRRELETNEVDPLVVCLVSRMCAAAVAGICLTVVFTGITLATGFFVAAGIGYIHVNMAHYLDYLFQEIRPQDYLVLIAKAVIPATVQSAIAFTEGARVTSLREIPRAVRSANYKAVAAVLLLLAGISMVAFFI
jgi:phospholipid/cholesterol/gamma-HCH transport system permease protein